MRSISCSSPSSIYGFEIINLAENKINTVMPKTQLQQYYSRMSGLMKWHDKRKDGRYALTVIGKVIYNIHTTTKKVFSEYYERFIVGILVIKEYHIMEKLYYLTYY